MGVKISYYAITDGFTPTECLRQAIEAERLGFDAIAVEDHFIPMPGGQQCNFAWTVMSSALQATERASFFTSVTAPIMRYHPAIVAQAFATMGAMYPGRVGIGVGAGEPPNEMALRGGEWPSNATRQEMLEEAITIMNRLWTSTEPVSFAGMHYTLNNAMVLTKPAEKIPVWVSAIGPRAARLAGRLGDHLMTLATDAHYVKEVLLPNFEAGAREADKDPKTMERAVQVNYIYDPDQVIPPELQKVEDPGTVPGIEKALELSLHMSWPQSAEDIIATIESLTGMGFDHIAVGNHTPSNASWRRNIETARQRSAIPAATLDRLRLVTWDETASLKVWEDVLPHVR
jgi:secondary-alcohol dehydrogenase (coenzyme-F420)